jgi:hypothetical protein
MGDAVIDFLTGAQVEAADSYTSITYTSWIVVFTKVDIFR